MSDESGGVPASGGGVAPSTASQLASDGVLYLVPVIIGAVLPLVRLPIVTRYITTDDYGAWALATVYAAFVTSIASLGLPVAYERNFFEQTTARDRGALLYTLTAFVAVACVFFGVATYAWREVVSLFLTGRSGYGDLMFWTYCGTAVVAIKSYFLLYLRNSGDAKSYVRYTLDDTVGGTVLSMGLIVFANTGVIGLALGSVVASGLVMGLVLRRAFRDLPPRLEARKLASALKIGLPLMPRVFLRVVTANVDKYVVGALSSVGGVGIYAVGQRVGYSVFTLMTAMENVFNPQMYRRMFAGGADAGRDVGRLLTPYVYLSVGAAIVVAGCAPELVTLLTAPDYSGAIPVAVIFSVYYATLFFGKIPQLTFAKKTGRISLLAAIGTAFNVGCALLLVPRWGAVGAAAATLIGGVLGDAVYFAVSQRAYRIEWEYRRLMGMFGLLAAMAAVTLWMTRDASSCAASIIARAMVLALYAWLGVHIGLLSRENWTVAVGLIRRRLGVIV